MGRDDPREIERRLGDREAVAGVVDDSDARPEFLAEGDQFAAGEILVVLDDDRQAFAFRSRRIVGEL